MELRSVGVDEVPALSHTRPVVLLVQVEDLEHHNRHQSCLDSRLDYRVTTTGYSRIIIVVGLEQRQLTNITFSFYI